MKMIDRQAPVSLQNAHKPDLPDAMSGLSPEQTEAWLMAVIGSAMDGVVIIDAARRIVLMNSEAETMFGCQAGQVTGERFDMLLSSSSRAEQSRMMDRFAAQGNPHSSEARTPILLTGTRTDGDEFRISAMMSRVMAQDENFLVLSLREIALPTDNGAVPPLRVERRKRAVSSQQASELEKRRVSRELYDDLGQRLSVLKLDMDWIEKSLPDAEKLSPTRIAQMQGLLDNIILRTKSIASSLRPPLLDDFGLLPAITWMADMFQKKTGVPCTVESNGVASKPGDPIESAIFRVVQEGLLNIERHARANQVRIVIWRTGNRVDVQIEDNGVGMPAGSDSKPGCYGLIAMQERIYTLGGTISISNTAPQGVSIRASIPFDASPLYQGNTP